MRNYQLLDARKEIVNGHLVVDDQSQVDAPFEYADAECHANFRTHLAHTQGALRGRRATQGLK